MATSRKVDLWRVVMARLPARPQPAETSTYGHSPRPSPLRSGQ